MSELARIDWCTPHKIRPVEPDRCWVGKAREGTWGETGCVIVPAVVSGVCPDPDCRNGRHYVDGPDVWVPCPNCTPEPVTRMLGEIIDCTACGGRGDVG